MGHEIVTVFGKSIQSKKKNSKILLYRFKIIPRKTMDYNEIVGNYQLLKKKSIVKYRFKINSNETMDYDQL